MATKEIAIEIAYDAHAGQIRRDGDPFVSHPIAVMNQMEQDGFPELYQIGAVLHDTVEDNEFWTLDRLRVMGFGERVIRIVDILSKKPGQSNDEYEAEILASYEVSQIKARDMKHNLNSNPKQHKITQYLGRLAKIEEIWGFEYKPELENTF